jgi:hypothetical protein
MALISKKTFRKWAQVLTDRQLTLENVERFAEIGNTVSVTRKVEIPFGETFAVNQRGSVSFKVGLAWLNGTSVGFAGGLTTGDTRTLLFDSIDHKQKSIYCRLDFTHSAVLNENTATFPPDPVEVVQFYTTTYAVPSGLADFELQNTEDETGDYTSLPAFINTTTNAGTTGTRRIKVATLDWVEADPPNIPSGFWTASTFGVESPSKLIIFNINDYTTDGRWPTISSMILV